MKKKEDGISTLGSTISTQQSCSTVAFVKTEMERGDEGDEIYEDEI